MSWTPAGASTSCGFRRHAPGRLGAGPPLHLVGGTRLHLPLLTMVAALVLAVALASRKRALLRPAGIVLLAAYAAWTAAMIIT
jgi:hypothetical protein